MVTPAALDPAEPYVPVRLTVEHPETLSQTLLFFKWLLALPLYIVLLFYGAAAFVATFIAFWAILVTGRYPQSLFEFVKGYMTWSFRVYSYFPLMMSRHWLPDDLHPLKYEADAPAGLSRLVLVFIKLPSFLFNIVETLVGIGILVLFVAGILAWWSILFTGRYPKKLFDFNVSLLEWVARVLAWQWLMRDDWSLFSTTKRVMVLVRVGLAYTVISALVLHTSLSLPMPIFTASMGPRVEISSGVKVSANTFQFSFNRSGSNGLKANEHFNAGRQLLLQSQWPEAIEEFSKAIDTDSKMAIAYNDRALAYFNLGQYQRAIDDYDEVTRLDPQAAQPHNYRGLTRIQLGQYQPSVRDLDEAIRLNPQYMEAYANLALAYTLLN